MQSQIEVMLNSVNPVEVGVESPLSSDLFVSSPLENLQSPPAPVLLASDASDVVLTGTQQSISEIALPPSPLDPSMTNGDAATGPLSPVADAAALMGDLTAPSADASAPAIAVEESSLFPLAGATDVNPQTPVRVEFSRAIDQSTLSSNSFRLLSNEGTPVAATLGSDLTGGVVSLTPLAPLTARTQYTLDVTSTLTGLDGSPVTPFTASFTTGDRTAGAGFAFTRQQVLAGESRFGVTSVAIGPDGNAYASDITGAILRYNLDPSTGQATGADTVFSQPGAQIVGLAFAPDATATDLRLWVSHAQRGQGNFTGTISELTVPTTGTAIVRRDVITGLPHTPGLQHQPNGIAFGPDGRLYQSVGGLTTLGGTRNWGVPETPLSAAVIVADLQHDAFQTGEPVNVQTQGRGENNYDPTAPDAPVTLFATGLRNGYDLAWHSNGNLYSGINANSLIGRFSPAGNGIPAVTARPHEMLALIEEGGYYGHPNPTRDEFVLNGGNPTSGFDPWEINQYPVGTQPEPTFDPSQLYSTRRIGGTSPNGLAEYTGFGDLNGRLLVSFFSGARTIQSFEFGSDGRVIDTDPLTDGEGNNITFSSPLDVAVHPSGAIYVANFGVSQGNPSNGALWVLRPIATERQPGTLSFSTPNYTLPEDSETASVALTIERSGGSSGAVSVILNLEGDTAQAGEDFVAAPITVTFAPGQTQQTVTLPITNDDVEEGAETLNLTLTLPTGGATIGERSATVTILDDDGADPTPLEPIGGNALFVAGSTRLTSAERQYVARLEALGYEVTIRDDNDSRSSDADGQDLILISETVVSSRVGRKFTDVAVPVITAEAYLFDDLGLTGRRTRTDFGIDRRQIDLTLTAAHPLAGGLSGEVTIYTRPEEVSWGRPGESAIVAAEDSQGRAAIFGYDAGAALASGGTAAARRVALPLWGQLTDDGLALLEAAVLWATGQRR